MSVLLLEPDDALTEVRLRAELPRLLGELTARGPSPEPSGSPPTSKMYFSGIERGELSAELRQRVDDARRRAAHPRVELGEQIRWVRRR